MTLKLLQWNIWFPEKAERVVAFLNDVQADVICLQELTTNCDFNPGISTGRFIAEKLSYHSYIEIAQRSKGRERDSIENGIFSRFPMTSQRAVHIIPPAPPETKDYSKEGRVYLESVIESPAGPLTVGTAHLSYTHRFQGSEAKQQEISNFLNCLSAAERFIFCGDFNTTPSSELIENLGRRYQPCGPSYSLNTWTTKPFEYNGFKEDGLNWRLDYVFSTPDLVVRNAQILQTDVSDHLPLLVEFELNDAG